MWFKKTTSVLIFCSALLPGLAQYHTAKKVIPDANITLKQGIYFTQEEFLNNDPGINFHFEIINKKSSYILFPEENNDYYVTYIDIAGRRVVLPLADIWGYYNGKGIYVSGEKGRPYQIMNLGAISILRYEKFFYKNVVSQAVTLYAFGISTKSVEKVKYMMLDLYTGKQYPMESISFNQIVKRDSAFFEEYTKDKSIPKSMKWEVYFEKFNKRYPLTFDNNKINLP